MNTVIENMITRRSCRGYKPDMIPEDVLEEILKAGTYAATGMGKQSPVILAVTNPEVRQRLSEVNAKIMGVDSDPFYGWIHRARETFERPEWKEFLKEQGIEGDYEGIGNCVLGYRAVPLKEAAPRKDHYVYRVK